MSDQHPRISEDQARELWQRALVLQNEAERERPEPVAPVLAQDQGLSLEQVAAAAEGAGIDPDYVRVTLAEQRLPDADRIDPRLWSARWLKWILREANAIEETRYIAAQPAQVYAALRTISLRPDFEMIHEATLGNDPVSDAVLVYRLPRKRESFHDSMNWTDARVLLFTIRAEEQGTRVRLRIPLFRRGVNLALTGGSAGLTGFGGMSVGSGLAGPIAGILGGAASIVALLPLVGGAVGGLLGVGAYRAIYRWILRDGRSNALRLLQAVEAQAEAARAAEPA